MVIRADTLLAPRVVLCNVAPWETLRTQPRSLSRVALDGDKAVRFVYVDESGISANESVLVVAGIVIEADSQWKVVQQYLEDLVSKYVREEDRPGFFFHASDLFHGSGKIWGNREIYSVAHSREALKALLNIPARFRLSVVFGYVRKCKMPNLSRQEARRETGANHAVAFSLCAIAAESFMHTTAAPREIATLVAENNSETHKAVKEAHNILSGTNLASERDKRIFDFLTKDIAPEWLPVRRIVDTVHFAEKYEASLLQIADACALVIRYCLEEKASAQEFINWFSQDHPEKIFVRGVRVSEDAPMGYNVLVFSAPAKKSVFARIRKLWHSWIRA
jgi:Protein of unknown function (DUF3800)